MRENKTVRKIVAESRRSFPLQPPQAAARGRALQAAVERKASGTDVVLEVSFDENTVSVESVWSRPPLSITLLKNAQNGIETAYRLHIQPAFFLVSP